MTDDLKTQIGKMIKDERRSKKLSQSELASLVGIGQKHLSRIENGANSNVDTLEKIFMKLAIAVDFIYV